MDFIENSITKYCFENREIELVGHGYGNLFTFFLGYTLVATTYLLNEVPSKSIDKNHMRYGVLRDQVCHT